MKINPGIFKAYDIRGKYPAEINEEVAQRVGRAVLTFCAKNRRKKNIKILICRDVRTSSLPLKNALVEGVLSQGGDAVDAGVGTTPYFYFLMHTKDFDGGVMVTASHNPAEYNGFKIRAIYGKAVSSGKGLEEVKKLVLKNKFPERSPGKILQMADFKNEYLNHLSRGISINKIRAVVDASGGSTAYFLPELLNRFPGFIYKPLFFEPDGTFRKHPPNPFLEKSQQFVKTELKNGGYRFGAIFDGDGDRVFFFDEKGDFVRPEFVFALLVQRNLEKNKKNSFAMTVNTSRAVREYIAKLGGRVKISRVGYAFMQDVMKRAGAPLGVEISGHFYFKEMFFDDSGILAFLKLADFMSLSGRSLSKLVETFKNYESSGELNFSVKDKKRALARVGKYYKNAKKSHLDGLTVEFPDWWFNIRPSNTEALVRLVVEAKNKELLEEKIKELKGLIVY